LYRFWIENVGVLAPGGFDLVRAHEENLIALHDVAKQRGISVGQLAQVIVVAHGERRLSDGNVCAGFFDVEVEVETLFGLQREEEQILVARAVAVE
jgi:hypothetical protein